MPKNSLAEESIKIVRDFIFLIDKKKKNKEFKPKELK